MYVMPLRQRQAEPREEQIEIRMYVCQQKSNASIGTLKSIVINNLFILFLSGSRHFTRTQCIRSSSPTRGGTALSDG